MMLGRVLAVCVGVATALRSPTMRTPTRGTVKMASADPYASISTTLSLVEEKQLLSKVAKLGVLTKLERAGLRLRDVEPLLVWAEDNGLVGAIGELNDDLLPLLPGLVSVAPLALPLLGAAVTVPAVAFFGLSAASLGGAYAVTSIPDDSIQSVALQTFLAIPLATLFPVLFAGLGVVSGKLNA
mmetsp:Transcript_3963/g.12180  ORF Transcript_3963/g.12180 Transcript_3963/m.12180 type:complete len:184 (-) Transcript_3963:290-841(-)|eukprot:CAMPEP_0197394074 /NCGR_PEP_ID=MMETSP1165-20131217/4679_1 /TAXON_ID=284809 /ORGANISM="Chrysocystis fragilis, Strain CCMP3189" /LENGTH=183 /DNA_ID=CAMNT_0042919757 /DNA_START=90 /DNA_END=641 /DNA_ORIENTATION=+